MQTQTKEQDAAANTATQMVSITQELTNFLNDLKKAWMDEARKTFDAELKKAIDAQKLEIATVMRKTFGLDDNLPVTKAEVIDIIRKAALEANPQNSRSPAPTQTSKPEGDSPVALTQAEKIEQAYKDFKEGKR